MNIFIENLPNLSEISWHTQTHWLILLRIYILQWQIGNHFNINIGTRDGPVDLSSLYITHIMILIIFYFQLITILYSAIRYSLIVYRIPT